MNKIFVVLVALCVCFLTFESVSYAAKKDKAAAKFRHADKNKDGLVDKTERHMEKKWEEKHKVEKESEVKNWWEKRADINDDGVVDKDESAAWKKIEKERIDLNGDGEICPKERRLCWRHAKSRANTATEKKYDANGDGWLEPEEVKEMLKDRQTLIETKGKAKVDSAIEEEYDENGDGVIDGEEAEALIEDIKDTE